MTTRVLMVEIRGEKAMVDRAANLLQDQVRAAATFVQAAVENFADDRGRTADDPPVVGPSITVSNALAHGSPKGKH